MTLSPPKTRWWHAEPDSDRIICDLCPRECKLGEDQRGFCFVRKNEGGEMRLTTYGRSTGFCIDPIEKKPLNHFLPGTPVLSFGTAGCNLGCKFCQNWDISKSREIEILSAEASPEGIAAAAKSHGCRSIAFTYNDPVIWAEYAIDAARAAHAESIKTVAVTAGYITPEARPDFFEHIDAANVDLKAFTDLFYRKLAFARLDPILETLVWLKNESDTWFELTNLIIPGENDSPDEFHKMCDWVLENLGDEVPVHFTAFHPDFKMRDKPPTPHESLIEARQIALDRGIKFPYVGNVLDRERQSTYCPGCGELIIERDHYAMGTYQIADSRCAHCSKKIAGVFEGDRGDWGRKRLPISIPSMAVKKNDDPDAPAFTEAEGHALTDFARAAVEAAVTGGPKPELNPGLAATPCVGVFVSLKRGHQLRACIGNLNENELAPLGGMIDRAAAGAAVNDRRFPRIHPLELPLLVVEVSVMHDLQIIEGKGDARAEPIQVGAHGLIISHSQGRGLLLPQVASERDWDAKTFLNQVCLKAGLPQGFWKKPAATLKTFRGEIFEADPPGGKDLQLELLADQSRSTLIDVVLSGFEKQTREFQVATELIRPQPTPTGILLECEDGTNSLSMSQGGSLIDLVKQGTRNLLNDHPDCAPLSRLVLLTHPITLSPDDPPKRFGSVVRSPILGRLGDRTSFLLDGQNTIQSTFQNLGIQPSDWAGTGAELTTFHLFEIPASAASKTNDQGAIDEPTLSDQTPETARAGGDGGIREPAVAGKFYPGSSDQMQRELDSFFFQVAPETRLKECRGIMLPHAGWKFCGQMIAETVSRTRVPEQVVIISPKHTPLGANWSISGHTTWKLPHESVSVDQEAVSFLSDRVPALKIDTEAHREEHGIEVILPFLLWANPRIKVVPIVLGSAEFDELGPLANALAKWRAVATERDGHPPLFVISSDMNHFGTEEENRRLDEMALEPFRKADSRGLFDTCVKNAISMCGLRPAVAILEALNQERHCDVEITQYDTSATVSGDTNRVVGYAGALLK
ncbi:MAG: AmmeMemoRadiSam system radical SAM enzyme [Verrucomicrobiales bacterium]|nr:AmmeMemoRadiSam system radical SAM enzyme [Verrucomicrobiales bacterium]